MVKNNNTFVEISNKDIYEAIQSMKELNAKEHNDIVKHLEFTNGKVKLAKWLGTTAMSLITIIIIAFVNHVGK